MGLSRERVIGAAVDILATYGLGDLTMRRLARELDVALGALYWHVENKQELLVEVAAELLSRVELPSRSAPATEGVFGLASAIRAAIMCVPDAAEVVGLAHAVDAEALRPLHELRRLVQRTGVAAGERDAVADLFVHHILGSVAAQQDRERAARLDNGFDAPDAAAATKSFEIGLSAILRGLAPTP